MVERKEQRTKTERLDINLITTQLNIAANRCAVNRFLTSLSKFPINTSAAPRSGPLIDQPDALVKGKRGKKRKKKIECLLYDSHQKGKMMIMIMKTPESQVDSPVAEGKRKEGGGRKMRDLHKDT